MADNTWRAMSGAAAVALTLGMFAGGGVEATPTSVLTALSALDGSEVTLSGVVIDKVVTNPPYLVHVFRDLRVGG